MLMHILFLPIWDSFKCYSRENLVLIFYCLCACTFVAQLLSRVQHFAARGLQHTRLSCPSPFPGAFSNLWPLSQWCHPTISFYVIPFSSCIQSTIIRIFSNESTFCIRWSKYWSFISPSNEYSRLTFFRIHRFDLLAVQGTLRYLLLKRLLLTLLKSQFKSISSLALSLLYEGFPSGSAGKESACNSEDLGSIPGLRRSPGEGKGYPLQYFGLENSMDYSLTSIYDYLKNHSFDYMDFCRQSDVSAF